MSYTPQTPYVTVQFESRYEPGVYAGRPYSYIADHRLAVGDVVPVETKFGDTVAKVVEVDVPEYRIKAVLPMLKRITAEPHPPETQGKPQPTPTAQLKFFD